MRRSSYKNSGVSSKNEKAQSTVLGAIMLIGLVVGAVLLFSGALNGVVSDTTKRLEKPSASFTIDDTGKQVIITHSTGDGIEPENLRIDVRYKAKSKQYSQSDWSGKWDDNGNGVIDAGDAIGVGKNGNIGDSPDGNNKLDDGAVISIRWVSGSGSQTSTLQTYTVHRP